jgi:hypothetical protein
MGKEVNRAGQDWGELTSFAPHVVDCAMPEKPTGKESTLT